MSILDKVDHRPWPLPDGPWIMRQEWERLLFAHWPVEPQLLQPFIPAGFTLDTFEEQAWIGVVPFAMRRVRPRFLPAIKGLSDPLELNLRTYVTAENKPGVYFLTMDASNPIVVWLARTTYHLPYCNARMHLETDAEGLHHYQSARTDRRFPPAELDARYRPIGPVFNAQPGTLHNQQPGHTHARGDPSSALAAAGGRGRNSS
jgi:uncharacterized protein